MNNNIFNSILSILQKMLAQSKTVSENKNDNEKLDIIDTKITGVKMDLQVIRFSSQKDSTLGMLMNKASTGLSFVCFTIEDEYRTVKVYNETRIPAGKYKVKLRSEGSFHEKYLAKFGADFHKGMLWVTDVPNFEYILIHIGNSDDDTAGCLLVGNTSQQNITEEGTIGGSTEAYKRIYPQIRDAILEGKDVFIEYVDFDKKS